ncbi:NACHT domain-containing protein [Kibdelosporangium aridum]|uniref:AAA+ ATPase domain-containing protein n=1 Tax=Kibdelosporangium aridum TaxID=2030 RepID=A0A1Y5YCF9_KIBAR|nr:AAA family ATPase [Kibdelosporangium aridum]SMD27032.1 hypothetical protein SAMN05661093_10628 [Kibdelosporangium aridum]
MRKNPALTYRGALRLLGKSDSKLVNALDTLLGGLILASPLSPVATLFQMVDQKNEAISLLRKLVSGVAQRIYPTKGYERYELITAAHTVIVTAAFFDAYRETTRRSAYARANLSEREKLSIVTDTPPADAEEAIALLVSYQLPMPPMGEGLYQSQVLRGYYQNLLRSVDRVVRGLDTGQSGRMGRVVKRRDTGRSDKTHEEEMNSVRDEVVARAETRYQSYFIELANDVPEFFVWVTVAGLRGIQGVHQELRMALAEEKNSLGRIEEILTRLSVAWGRKPDTYRHILVRANRSVLTETVMPNEALDQFTDMAFPAVERVYQSPRFRVADAAKSSPADENWWALQPMRSKLDLFFASFLTSLKSVSAPLLLLGHPGAGKSLLTKVLAARLPESGYIAIRVPLRRVDADAPVIEQIQQALDLATNRRVHWADLVDEGDTTRVVFLDGLDELLQASSRGRASYLQDVAEFQLREAEQERPIAFVVTSRTVVADQVRIPADATLMKLEEFSDEQIADWLGVWSACNQDNIAAGVMGEVSLDVVMKHRGLACQPLLLMMLAVYAADPSAPPLDAKMSNAVFYARILDDFVRREVAKRDSTVDVSDLIEDQLWRLGIAAFAMFNRDRQDVSDHLLGSDILALTGETPSVRPDRVGHETISRFFFVYTAEADAHREEAHRAYEFLHATFGEYLVAHYSVKVLLEVAGSGRKTRRGGREYDDDLLFALLCNQSLTTRQSIADFIGEIFARMTEQEQTSCVRTLDVLLDSFRNRSDSSTYEGYQPLPVDDVRKLAAYSANLVLLRTLLAPGFDPPDWWVATVSLWRAGLGTGWETQCRALARVDGRIVLRKDVLQPGTLEIAFHQMCGDVKSAALYQWGWTVADKGQVTSTNEAYSDLVAFLVEVVLNPGSDVREEMPSAMWMLEDELSPMDMDRLFRLIGLYVAKRAPGLTSGTIKEWIRLALDCRQPGVDLSVLAAAIAVHPELLLDLPELMVPEQYNMVALLIFFAAQVSTHQPGNDALRALRDAVAARHSHVDFNNQRVLLILLRRMLHISWTPPDTTNP